MAIHVTPIPQLINLAAPAFTLGTANTAGAAASAVASNSTLLVFDTTVAGTSNAFQASSTGSATITSRRDHGHGVPATADWYAMVKLFH
jgi:hypothetical protein